ncbi:unnamed protein product, partial [Nesidiocoris tenuis]
MRRPILCAAARLIGPEKSFRLSGSPHFRRRASLSRIMPAIREIARNNGSHA